MSDPRPTSFLQRMTRARHAVREPEPADLGTAFGLEQTVDDTTWAPTSPPVASPAARSGGWWRWLSGRGASR